MFGSFLREMLKNAGVSDEGLITDNLHNTTLAFVALNSDGEPASSAFTAGISALMLFS